MYLFNNVSSVQVCARQRTCRNAFNFRSLHSTASNHQTLSSSNDNSSQPPTPSIYNLPQNVVDPFKLVEQDLDNLYTNIRQELSTPISELQDISRYYFDGHGKAFRPLIIILIARSINHHLSGQSQLLNSQKNVSLVIEMIHTASLIHDDVIDAADTRRGKPSVNSVWGYKKSIITGDFVISRGSQILSRLNDPYLISMLSEAIVDLVLGEFMQMGSKENADERFQHYIQKTFKKTASLIAYTCKAVAYLAGADEQLQESAFSYGKHLGIAFQLVDDLLDFVSNQSELGKPAAADLKLGLATAPVLFASEKFPELNDMIARRFSGPGDVERTFEAVIQVRLWMEYEFTKLISFNPKSNGLQRTKMLARKHADDAISHISSLKESPEKTALVHLCDMVLNRKK